MKSPVYFDNNASTKTDDRVVEVMMPFFTSNYGNASSRMHVFGWQAEAAVEKAREQIASLIACETSEIIFTSGATEAVNMAIIGIFRSYKAKGNHIITVKTEHKAVLDTCAYLTDYENAEITYLNVDKEGLIDVDELNAAIKPTTVLISIMAANNETGVIQPIEKISEIANQHHVVFFSDATQYVGKLNCNVIESGIHCLSLSAHKFYGPKGIGALYIRRKNPKVNLQPLFFGGGQESGKRPGTLNVPLIAGFGKAAELARLEIWDNNTHVSRLRNHFEHNLLDINGLIINGSTKNRLYNTSNITFPRPLQNMAQLLKNFAFSSGSACSSALAEPSHVLSAMGLSNQDIKNTYRFSFGKYNTLNEVNSFLSEVKNFNFS